tara:strand:- start:42 stop:887 length:846 start_codon:yes stop_codon:yes gene_type:complete
MIPVKGYTTFHPLKHCIVGSVHAPDSVSDDLKDIMQTTTEDLDALVETLRSFDVSCYRPEPTDVTKRPPVSPRDYFIAMGETLFVGKLINGYKDILGKIDKKNIKWFLDSDISSGNMIRCGNHVHWDISNDVKSEAETSILAWLRESGYRTTVTRHGWHMDGVYSILKPGVIVATKELPTLEKIYPGWDICYLEKSKKQQSVDHRWGGNSAESNYDVNILSVNEETCIITERNKTLITFLEKNRINPIICQFRNKEFWDNGVHCFTQDIYREGVMEDYFGQ